LLARVPFGQAPSLHPLRRRSPGLVRELRGYYGPVRPPRPVHRRRASVDFPARPAGPSPAGGQGLSRFSREVCRYMPGVSDRAGLPGVSRYRRPGCSLPPSSTASASRSEALSRLNTRPARSPVNASHPSSRTVTLTREQRDAAARRTPDQRGASGDDSARFRAVRLWRRDGHDRSPTEPGRRQAAAWLRMGAVRHSRDASPGTLPGRGRLEPELEGRPGWDEEAAEAG